MTQPKPIWSTPSRPPIQEEEGTPSPSWARWLRVALPCAAGLMGLLIVLDFLLPRQYVTLRVEWSGFYQEENQYGQPANGESARGRLILEGERYRFNTLRIEDYFSAQTVTVAKTPMLSRSVGIYPGTYSQGRVEDVPNNSIYWLFPLCPVALLLPLLTLIPLRGRDARMRLGLFAYTLLGLYLIFAFASTYYWE